MDDTRTDLDAAGGQQQLTEGGGLGGLAQALLLLLAALHLLPKVRKQLLPLRAAHSLRV